MLTVPESRATLSYQREQLIAGNRKAMLYHRSQEPLPLPDGMAEHDTPVGLFHYNPAECPVLFIDSMVRAGLLNLVLNLGPHSKGQIAARLARGEPDIAVVEMAPDGMEVRAAWGTIRTAEEQLAYFTKTATPGHTCFVTSPAHVIAARRGAAMMEAQNSDNA